MCPAPESDTNAPLGLSSETPPWCGISFLHIWRMPPYSNVTVPLLSERSLVISQGQETQKQLPPMEQMKTGWGHFNVSWNVQNEDAGPLPSGVEVF